ncbi:MAG: type II toxin-antitoxin system VapC family toxin [Armatimonadetes bacterium]|nr:type II toxin-antitoxin system VapC family toxin [Armatimonadota bacterium]
MTATSERRRTDWPPRIFLDTNFIVNVVFQPGELHAPALTLLQRLLYSARLGDVQLYLSPLVLDEVWWKLAEVLYDEAHGPQASRRQRWGRRKAALEEFGQEIRDTTALLLGQAWVTLVDVSPRDVDLALRYATHSEEPHLAPRDAFHLAVMKRLGIEAIVTNDPDFAKAPGIVAIPYSGS